MRRYRNEISEVYNEKIECKCCGEEIEITVHAEFQDPEFGMDGDTIRLSGGTIAMDVDHEMVEEKKMIDIKS